MYFTREPIVETVISSREGYKLHLRNSKGGGQEEFLVDAVEVISFGKNCFYRSLEKPKSFLLPITDYEIVETRETKLILKTGAVEKGGIKIGGGKEGSIRGNKEEEKAPQSSEEERKNGSERKREKRRFRKRKEHQEEAIVAEEEISPREERPVGIIPPPTTLISDSISRYRELPGFSQAFFDRSEKTSVAVEIEREEYHPPQEKLEDDEIENNEF